VGEAVRIADGLFAGYVGTVAGRTRDGYQIQLDAALLGAHTITVRPRWVEVAAMARAA
jgi:ribosomal protein L21E